MKYTTFPILGMLAMTLGCGSDPMSAESDARIAQPDAEPAKCEITIPTTPAALVAEFIDLWNIEDSERRCALKNVWADDAVYLSKDHTFANPEELLSFIASGTRPLTLTSGTPIHHRGIRFTWNDGQTNGTSLAVLNESGQIQRLVSYSGQDATLVDLGPYNEYLDAWNATSPPERNVLLDSSWAEDGYYVDPSTEINGRIGLSSVIQSYLNQFNNRKIILFATGPKFGGHYWVEWSIRNLADDTDLVRGMDFCELSVDGTKIQSLFSFFGSVPELGFGGNEADCLSCFERQLSGGNPADLCTEGTPSSTTINNAMNQCICASACASECGDNLCVGQAPNAECGACLSRPGNMLEACPEETNQCWTDG